MSIWGVGPKGEKKISPPPGQIYGDLVAHLLEIDKVKRFDCMFTSTWTMCSFEVQGDPYQIGLLTGSFFEWRH